MKRPIKLISQRCYYQDQSWYFERTVSLREGTTKSIKLKVSIRRNAYDNQSYARVYMWDGTKWNQVVNSPITECVCKIISYVNLNITVVHFEDDYTRLLNEALKICWD